MLNVSLNRQSPHACLSQVPEQVGYNVPRLSFAVYKTISQSQGQGPCQYGTLWRENSVFLIPVHQWSLSSCKDQWLLYAKHTVTPVYYLQGSWPILKQPVQQPSIQGPCVEPQISRPRSPLFIVGRYDGDLVIVIIDSCKCGQVVFQRAQTRDTVQLGGHSTGASCAAYDFETLRLFLAERMRPAIWPWKSTG